MKEGLCSVFLPQNIHFKDGEPETLSGERSWRGPGWIRMAGVSKVGQLTHFDHYIPVCP